MQLSAIRGKKGIAEKERCASNRFKRKKGRLRKILNVVFLLRRQRSAAIKSNGDVFPRALAANHLSCRLASTLKSSFLFPFLDAVQLCRCPVLGNRERKKFVCFLLVGFASKSNFQHIMRACFMCVSPNKCVLYVSNKWLPAASLCFTRVTRILTQPSHLISLKTIFVVWNQNSVTAHIKNSAFCSK